MAIQVLDQSTINQIAAGEVVERPASVVKELMENAIDARATAVTVEIRQGGIGFIRITDNGCGIPKEELSVAFLRHSTSKIRTAEDLLTVSSLGFRGEALSSIAAVSQVELITKTADSLTGSRYQIEGGKEKSLEEVGAPEGTTFISRNLFFNTPARRKFLKTETTEGAHVADLVEKIALSHPEISIRLIVNGQNRLHTSGNHNLKDIIYTVYGREITANLLPVEAKTSMVQVSGFIGKPLIARGNRNFENYFINGRYIKSGLVSKAIEDAYKSFMMQHKYPFTLLHLTVEPEYIDVNVHPSKMELRFKDGEGMYRILYEAVLGALTGRELIPDVSLPESREEKKAEDRAKAGGEKTAGDPKADEAGNGGPRADGPRADSSKADGPGTGGFGAEVPRTGGIKADGPEEKRPLHRAPEPFEKKRLAAMGGPREERAPYGEEAQRPVWAQTGSAWGARPTSDSKSALAGDPRPAPPQTAGPAAPAEKKQPAPTENAQSAPPSQMEMFDNRLLSEKARARHRLIGQVFDTYWLVEYDGSLYIIDQHAAHEKVLFEKNFASLKSREYTSQLVSPPIILTLSMQEADLLKRHMDVFTQVGFEIEPFGGNEYAVRAVPANLLSLAKKELLLEMLDGLSEETAGKGAESIYNRIATISCKAAVKGNSRLSAAEADALIDELLSLENPYTCPHGRPTIISISKYEMEKKFKRIV